MTEHVIPAGEPGSESRPYFISLTAPEDASMVAFGALKNEKVKSFCFLYHDMAFRIDTSGKMEYLDKAVAEKNEGITLDSLKDGLIAGLLKKIESAS